LSKCFCQGKEGERLAGRGDEMGEAKKREWLGRVMTRFDDVSEGKR
jgi:hypothetical protein